ncbi:MAG: rhodanese-like domain-containing protein [Bacteroidota bacterium]
MKKIIIEIIAIVIFASVLGLLYNYFSEKPLPLIYKQEAPKFVHDSILFAGIDTASTQVKKIDNTPLTIDNNKLQNITKEQISGNTDSKENNTTGKDALTNKVPDIKINSTSSSGFNNVNYAQVVKLLGNPKIVFIDARTAEEFGKAHIGNAMNIYPYDKEEVFMPRIASLPRDKTFIVYCEGGNCDLSHMVAKIMKDFGFERVFIYVGGWNEWSAKREITN